MACFVFLWVPACAGMTGGDLRCHPHPGPLPSRERGCCRRVKSPGRYLTRSLRVNGLGFSPLPRSGRGCFDRVMDRACYQQSQTVAIDAAVIGPRRGGLPDSQQKSSARVVRRQDVGPDPRTWLRMRCHSPSWTPAHAVVSPMQRDGRDIVRVHENSTGPFRLWLSRLACTAEPSLNSATSLYCSDRFPRGRKKVTRFVPLDGPGRGDVAYALSWTRSMSARSSNFRRGHRWIR